MPWNLAVLASIRNSVVSRISDCPPVLNAGEATLCIMCLVLGPSLKERDIEVLQYGQRKAVELVKVLENKSYKGQPRKLGLFSLDKRRLKRDLIVVHSCLKGGCRKEGFGLFSYITSTRLRGQVAPGMI